MADARQGLRRTIRRFMRWRIWRVVSTLLDFGPQLVLLAMLSLLPALGLMVRAVADIGSAVDGRIAALATGAARAILSTLTQSAIAFGMLVRVRRMTACVKNLDAGRENATLHGEYLNVFGALARAIDPIIHNSLQAARLRSGLDVAASRVMISNANGNIVYVNDVLRDLFESFPDRVREQFRAVAPCNLVATPMRTFYSGARNEFLVRASRGQMEDQPDVEGVAHIGSRTLRVRISSIVQSNGCILGSVAQWDDSGACGHGRCHATELAGGTGNDAGGARTGTPVGGPLGNHRIPFRDGNAFGAASGTDADTLSSSPLQDRIPSKDASAPELADRTPGQFDAKANKAFDDIRSTG